ncbi:MAG: rhodanese-like domain-containing protein, partial [Hyphomicrobium sp.]
MASANLEKVQAANRTIVRFPLGPIAGLICSGVPTFAYAIPSPELVVSSVSSLAQLFALLGATLSGGAVAFSVRSFRGGRQSAGRSALARIITAALLVCVGAAAGGGYTWLEHVSQQTQRLEAPLQRPVRTNGGPSLSVSVRELSFAQQMKHPLGIATGDADTLIAAYARGERSDVVVLDVRETAETELRTLPGAQSVRGPDLGEARLDIAGKQAIAFCQNGSRSHETCQALASQGIDCRFIVGGLEKWFVEGRPMAGAAPRKLSDIRAIPGYSNQMTLLETRQVHQLVQQEKAVFVDVRHPDEFKSSHLPEAVNIPINRIPTGTLKAVVANLPRRPVILPCNDRRNCFFAEVLGYELSRAGHDYRGRYTVPSEYFISTPRPPYVERWIGENQRSIWRRGVDITATLIAWLAQLCGLPAAIMLLALVSRLLVLPISLKAERDQAKSANLAAEMTDLKARLRHDSHRFGRAMRALYRRHGLTPGRNLVALLFLPIMALAVAGVHQVAAEQPGQRWLWLENVSAPDPVHLLPMLFGTLITFYLHITIARSTRQRIVVWALVMPAMMAIATPMSAAADIYLVSSAMLLLAQRAIIGTGISGICRRLQGLRQRLLRMRVPAGVIWLDDIEKQFNCGNKARRLGQLMADGVLVPQGLVLTEAFLTRIASASQRRRRRRIDRLWRTLGCS